MNTPVPEAVDSQLAMEELWSWAVVDPGAIRGGVVLSDSSVMVWGPASGVGVFRRFAGLSMHAVPNGTPLPGWNGRGMDNAAAIVDRERGQLFEIGPDGKVVAVDLYCPQASTAVELLALEGALLGVHGFAPPDGYVLRYYRFGTGYCELISEATNPCNGRPSLTPGKSIPAIITCADAAAPLYQAWDKQGSIHVREIPSSRFPVETWTLWPAARWHGLPLLELDKGFLRVFADLRTDLRYVALWSDGGEFVRGHLTRTPVGFFASDPQRRRLLALRGGPSFELVLVAWSWLAEGR